MSEADGKVAKLQAQQTNAAIDSKAKAIYEEKLAAAERDIQAARSEAQADLRKLQEDAALHKAKAHTQISLHAWKAYGLFWG